MLVVMSLSCKHSVYNVNKKLFGLVCSDCIATSKNQLTKIYLKWNNLALFVWCWYKFWYWTLSMTGCTIIILLTLKLGHGNLRGVVSQERNHQTLQRKTDVRSRVDPSSKFQTFFLIISNVHSPWLSTSYSLPQGRRGSGASRTPGRPPPPFSWGDNAGRSSLAWPHLLSVEDQNIQSRNNVNRLEILG